VHVKRVLSRRSGRFLLREATTPPRRKGPVGHLVAKKDAPTKRRVEVYVVDMEACQLATKKGAPTKRRVEVYVVDMEACQLVAKKDAPTKRRVEVYVVDMEACQLAAKKDVPTMLSKEESV